MPSVDEQAFVLTPGRRLLLATALWVAATAGCRFTEVAIINIRNETATNVALRAHLVGRSEFGTPVTLKPQDERVMIQYEESWFGATPVSHFVLGLRLETPPSCVALLDRDAVTGAAERSSTHRRWTIRLTPDVLRKGGCP